MSCSSVLMNAKDKVECGHNMRRPFNLLWLSCRHRGSPWDCVFGFGTKLKRVGLDTGSHSVWKLRNNSSLLMHASRSICKACVVSVRQPFLFSNAAPIAYCLFCTKSELKARLSIVQRNVAHIYQLIDVAEKKSPAAYFCSSPENAVEPYKWV